MLQEHLNIKRGTFYIYIYIFPHTYIAVFVGRAINVIKLDQTTKIQKLTIRSPFNEWSKDGSISLLQISCSSGIINVTEVI